VYTGSDAELAVAAKRLLKKDQTTKLKALAEVDAALQAAGEAQPHVLEEFLPFFVFVYRRLCLDVNSRVRLDLNRVLSTITGINKRALGPHMNALIGHWYLSLHDPVRDVAAAAREAFDKAIALKKQPSVLAFLSTHVLSLIQTHLAAAPETQTDVTQSSQDEAEDRYIMVVVGSLDALGTLMEAMPAVNLQALLLPTAKEGVETYSTDSTAIATPVSLGDILNDKLWKKLGAKRMLVRKAVLGLLCTVSRVAPTALWAVDDQSNGGSRGGSSGGGRLGPSLIKAMGYTDSSVIASFLEALLAVATAYAASGDSIYVHMDQGQFLRLLSDMLAAAPMQCLPYMPALVASLLPRAADVAVVVANTDADGTLQLADVMALLHTLDATRVGNDDDHYLTHLDETVLDMCTLLLVKWPGLTQRAELARGGEVGVGEDALPAEVGELHSRLVDAMLALLLHTDAAKGVNSTLARATKVLTRASVSLVLKGEKSWCDALWAPVGRGMAQAMVNASAAAPTAESAESSSNAGKSQKKKRRGKSGAAEAGVSSPYALALSVTQALVAWVGDGAPAEGTAAEGGSTFISLAAAFQALTLGEGCVEGGDACVVLGLRALLQLRSCSQVQAAQHISGTYTGISTSTSTGNSTGTSTGTGTSISSRIGEALSTTAAALSSSVPDTFVALLLANVPVPGAGSGVNADADAGHPQRSSSGAGAGTLDDYAALLTAACGQETRTSAGAAWALTTALTELLTPAPSGPLFPWLIGDGSAGRAFCTVLSAATDLVRIFSELPMPATGSTACTSIFAPDAVCDIGLSDRVAFLSALLAANKAYGCSSGRGASAKAGSAHVLVELLQTATVHTQPCTALKWALLTACPDLCTNNLLVGVFFGRTRTANRSVGDDGTSRSALVLSWDDVRSRVLPSLDTATVSRFAQAVVQALAAPLAANSAPHQPGVDIGSHKWARHAAGALSLSSDGHLGTTYSATALLKDLGLGAKAGYTLLALAENDYPHRENHIDFVLDCLSELTTLWRGEGGHLKAEGHWMASCAPWWLPGPSTSAGGEEEAAWTAWLALDVLLSLREKDSGGGIRPTTATATATAMGDQDAPDMDTDRRVQHRSRVPALTDATPAAILATVRALTARCTAGTAQSERVIHQVLASAHAAMCMGSTQTQTQTRTQTQTQACAVVAGGLRLGFAAPLARGTAVVYLSKTETEVPSTTEEFGVPGESGAAAVLRLRLLQGVVSAAHSDGAEGYFYTVVLAGPGPGAGVGPGSRLGSEVQTEAARLFPGVLQGRKPGADAHAHPDSGTALALDADINEVTVFTDVEAALTCMKGLPWPLSEMAEELDQGHQQPHSGFGSRCSSALVAWASEAGDDACLSAARVPTLALLTHAAGVSRLPIAPQRGLVLALLSAELPQTDRDVRRFAFALHFALALAQGEEGSAGGLPAWLLLAKVPQRVTVVAAHVKSLLFQMGGQGGSLVDSECAHCAVDLLRAGAALVEYISVRRDGGGCAPHLDPVFDAALALTVLGRSLQTNSTSADTDAKSGSEFVTDGYVGVDGGGDLVLVGTLRAAAILAAALDADGLSTSQKHSGSCADTEPSADPEDAAAAVMTEVVAAPPREAARKAALMRDHRVRVRASLREAGACLEASLQHALSLVLGAAPLALRRPALALLRVYLDGDTDQNTAHSPLHKMYTAERAAALVEVMVNAGQAHGGAGGKRGLSEYVVLARLLAAWLVRAQSRAAPGGREQGQEQGQEQGHAQCEPPDGADADSRPADSEVEEDTRSQALSLLGAPLLAALEGLPQTDTDTVGMVLLWAVALAILDAQSQRTQFLSVHARVKDWQWKARVATIAHLGRASAIEHLETLVPLDRVTSTASSSTVASVGCSAAVGQGPSPFDRIFLRILQIMAAADWTFSHAASTSTATASPMQALARFGTADLCDLGLGGRLSGEAAVAHLLLRKLDLVGSVLVASIATLPILVRQWWVEHGSVKSQRELCGGLSSFIEDRVSGLLTSRELTLIDSARDAQRLNDLTVTGSAVSRKIRAGYEQDEVVIEMKLTLPPSYPLRKVSVECSSKLAGDKQRKQWALQVMHLMSSPHTGGTVVDAVLMWKESVDKQMEGVEPCPICYGVLHPRSMSLPNSSCATCHNKFHSLCLQQWFRTSNKAKCVLCQQDWVY
jgi:hypothetical protein